VLSNDCNYFFVIRKLQRLGRQADYQIDVFNKPTNTHRFLVGAANTLERLVADSLYTVNLLDNRYRLPTATLAHTYNRSWSAAAAAETVG
jgi:hypothetical protein